MKDKSEREKVTKAWKLLNAAHEKEGGDARSNSYSVTLLIPLWNQKEIDVNAQCKPF